MKRLLLLVALFITFHAHAQDINFSLVNVLNGKEISLSTYPSCSGIVIIFTSNVCAFDEYYRSRIQKLSSEYQDKVPVLLVNAMVEPAESVEKMKEKANQLKLSIPYLADKDQTLMQLLGATRTPQAFLLKNNGGKFNVVYSGALDDNAQVEADVRKAYVKDAIDIMLNNQKIETAEVRPVGCTIRRK